MARASTPPARIEITDRDFELLAPARARSEDWNADRLELRRRLADAGKAWAAQLARDPGLGLDVHTSLHHPASFNAFRVDELRVYLSRDRAARNALAGVLGSAFRKDVDSAYRHVMLAFALSHEKAVVSLSIHPDAWWDAQNLAARAASRDRAGELATLLNQATGFALQIHDHRLHQAGVISRDDLERAFKHWKVGQHYLRFARSCSPAEVLALDAETLHQQIGADLAKLARVQSWMAWSPDSDFLFAGGRK